MMQTPRRNFNQDALLGAMGAPAPAAAPMASAAPADGGLAKYTGGNTGVAGGAGTSLSSGLTGARPGQATAPVNFTTSAGDSNPDFSDWLSKNPAPGLEAGWTMGGPNSAATEAWSKGAEAASRGGRPTAPVQMGTSVNDPSMGGMGAVPSGAGAASAPASGGLGQYANRLEGFNSEKLNNSAHNTPKYLIGRALSNFDPRQGATPEVLDALNKLGIGNFSGSGDKVSIANGDPRFDGVNSIDLVRGFKDPNGTGGWQYGAEGPAGPGGAQGGGSLGGGMPMPQGGNMADPMLGGDPMAKIQAALASYGGENQNLKALMAQLQGGGR